MDKVLGLNENKTQAVIYEKDGIQLVARKYVEEEACKFEGIQVVAIKKGHILINKTKLVGFGKSDILFGDANVIQKKLFRFDVEVDKDSSKKAQGILKNLLIDGKSTKVVSSINVDDLYFELMEYVLFELQMGNISSYRYEKEDDAVGIPPEILKFFLCDTGYKLDTFCRRLNEYSDFAEMKPLVVIRNKGRLAVNFNEGRFYLFRLEESLLGRERVDNIRRLEELKKCQH